MDTSYFYTSAAEVLASCHEKRDDISVVLDEDDGFAPRLSKICKKMLEEENMDFSSPYESSSEEATMLRLESVTWDLIQALTCIRKTEQPVLPSAHEILRQNPYTPTATLADAIMARSPLLKELVIVREWLHDNAPAPTPPEAATGYWKFTRLRLEQSLRLGKGPDAEKLVTELDPDASNREDKGRVLAAEDANYEKSLAQALYGYVRAGRLDEAIELCRRTKRPWRAASIRGSILFQWSSLAVEPLDEAEDESDFVNGWSGNKRRKLWKSACARAALNPLLSEPDRALHAALAPSPASSVVLKSVSRTWQDHLWAQISIICEGKQVDELARASAGGFWESGLDAVERIATARASNAPGVEAERKEEAEREEKEWEREVVSTLESLATVGVAEGPSASNPFHISQLHIILNRTDKLISEFAAGLQSGEFSTDQPAFSTLIRFFAHYCLFLQIIDEPVPADAMQVILEVYLQVLEGAGQREHIALYASALGENAIERYALFLTSLDLSVDLDERKAALFRAEKHDLDIIKVARAAAEKSVKKALDALPRMTIALPNVIAREASLSDQECFLIRSIEWTTFMEETYRDALVQANIIFRYFLGSGRVQAARSLLTLLPIRLKILGRDNVVDRTHSTEYAHYLQFFAIWDLFDKVSEIQFSESSHTTKGAKENWLNTYKTLLEDLREKTLELLTTEWLINEDLAEQTGDRRHQALVRIRRIYIPEIVIRLHAALVNSGDKIPTNLTHALNLANIVADSRYALYDDFVADDNASTGGVAAAARLQSYLLAVRQAVLKGLENGGSDPFRILSHHVN